MITKFNKKFTQQESIPKEAIKQAIKVLESGRIHRYNTVEDEDSETTLFELEFANYIGKKYVLACASGGYAMHITLCALGLHYNEPVLTNAFTLSPVPGAIHNAGGQPILVETTKDLVIDLVDLEQKIISSDSKILLLSHMRGHIVDMDSLCRVLDKYDIQLIEDCAHTMGAKWGGRKSGTFGVAGCFSTQSYKHLNSGEGGIIVTNDSNLIAKAIILSGSYSFYHQHKAAPKPSFFKDISLLYPNYSGRMDNLRAAILRPQLKILEKNGQRWNKRYKAIEEILLKIHDFEVPTRSKKEEFVGSSIQFTIPNFSSKSMLSFVEKCKDRGISIKWFGNVQAVGYTSNHHSWNYLEYRELPETNKVLNSLLDMRIPLTFTVKDCKNIANIICECFLEIKNSITSQ